MGERGGEGQREEGRWRRDREGASERYGHARDRDMQEIRTIYCDEALLWRLSAVICHITVFRLQELKKHS